MEFTGLTTDVLNATLNAIKDQPNTGAMVAAIKAELKTQHDAEVQAKETEALRTLADYHFKGLSDIAANKALGTGSAAYKHAALTLRDLVSAGYKMNDQKARKVIDVLTDTKGRTDSGDSVAHAVDYVNANPTSTVYRGAKSENENDQRWRRPATLACPLLRRYRGVRPRHSEGNAKRS